MPSECCWSKSSSKQWHAVKSYIKIIDNESHVKSTELKAIHDAYKDLTNIIAKNQNPTENKHKDVINFIQKYMNCTGP